MVDPTCNWNPNRKGGWKTIPEIIIPEDVPKLKNSKAIVPRNSTISRQDQTQRKHRNQIN